MATKVTASIGNEPREVKARVAFCGATKQEVVQQYIEEWDDWLCLHNDDTIPQDAEDVEQFKKDGTLRHNKFITTKPIQ